MADDSVSAWWSPDHSRLAFEAGGQALAEIYVWDVEREDLVRVTRNRTYDQHPSWSPDGELLVIQRHGEAHQSDGEIFIVQANGEGDPQRLTRNDFGDRNPVWSPNGETIAYTSDRGIFVYSLSEANQTRITRAGLRDSALSWSPDSKWLLFVRSFSESSSIMKIRSDGQRIQRLTTGSVDTEPQWAPGGSRIALVRCSTATQCVLGVMPSAGGEVTVITGDISGGVGPGDFYPRWHPRGTRIVFDGRVNGSQAVQSVRANGGPVTTLATPPSNATYWGLGW
ncbi:MAG TPA: DPP IV N-terminal domain-containing protein [Actinomycetota bacterium]|nr:DPP IV N-terminal domain-containing protein [Actinomycetota bacterium]